MCSIRIVCERLPVSYVAVEKPRFHVFKLEYYGQVLSLST